MLFINFLTVLQKMNHHKYLDLFKKNLFLLYLNVLSLTSFSGSNCYNEKSHKTKMNSLPKVIFLLVKQLKATPAYTLLHMPHSNNTQTYFHTYIRPNDVFTSGRAFLQWGFCGFCTFKWIIIHPPPLVKEELIPSLSTKTNLSPNNS